MQQPKITQHSQMYNNNNTNNTKMRCILVTLRSVMLLSVTRSELVQMSISRRDDMIHTVTCHILSLTSPKMILEQIKNWSRPPP